jgi:dolichyl-phosphate beta-glucosyltransferase
MAEYFHGQSDEWVIVVVSDGSKDRTEELVRHIGESEPRIILLAYQPNHGKGYAVRFGMMAIEADWLLFSDADLATPIEEIEKLWNAVADGKPIAIGSRPLKESELEIRQPWWRESLGRMFNMAVQTLGVRGIKDTQCGFKLFRLDVARDVFARTKIDGFAFDVEALMIARDLGYEIAEVPIRWQHKEGSKVSVLRDGSRMLRELLGLRMKGQKRRLQIRES